MLPLWHSKREIPYYLFSLKILGCLYRKGVATQVALTVVRPVPLQKCVGDFCCIEFGGLCRGFFRPLFPRQKKEEKQSRDKIRNKKKTFEVHAGPTCGNKTPMQKTPNIFFVASLPDSFSRLLCGKVMFSLYGMGESPIPPSGRTLGLTNWCFVTPSRLSRPLRSVRTPEFWGVAKGSSISRVAKLKGDKNSECNQ